MDSALAARLAAVPGVRAAIADVSVPARLGSRDSVAHGWSSAALTPYVLSAGRAPAGPGEAVTGYRARLGTRQRLASTDRRSHGHRRGRRPAPPRRRAADGDLPDRRRGVPAGRPSWPGGRDRRPRRTRLRRLAPARRFTRRGRLHRRCTRQGRASRAPRGEDDADRRHRVVRRAGAVHRDLRRDEHDGPVDPAARARDRAPARGGRHARSDPPHDRVGGRDRRSRRLAGRALAGSSARPGAHARPHPPRHRAAEPHRQRRLAADRRRRRGRGPRRAARRARRRTARRAGVADPRADPGRGRAPAARPGPRDRRTDCARRRDAAVRRLGHDRLSGDGRGDLGDDRALPRGGRRLPGAARGAPRRRDPRAAARAACAGRRLPGLGEPAHLHAALLLRKHAPDAHRRDELHAVVQHDDSGPCRLTGAARGRVERPRDHEQRPRPAGVGAGRDARHARRALGGRPDPDDARPEPGRLGRDHPRADPRRREGRRPGRRRHRRVADRAARRHDRARPPARRRRARPGR